MLRKRKQRIDPPHEANLTSKAQKLDRGEIADMLEIQLNSLCKLIPEYQRTKDPVLLEETRLCSEAIYVMAGELLGRIDGVVQNVARPARQYGRHY